MDIKIVVFAFKILKMPTKKILSRDCPSPPYSCRDYSSQIPMNFSVFASVKFLLELLLINIYSKNINKGNTSVTVESLHLHTNVFYIFMYAAVVISNKSSRRCFTRRINVTFEKVVVYPTNSFTFSKFLLYHLEFKVLGKCFKVREH